MSKRRILRLGSLKDVAQFQEQVRSLQIKIPCDREIARDAEIEPLKPLIAKLRRLQFGRSSEKRDR